MDVTDQSGPIDQNACWRNAIRLIASLAVQDFDGQLHRPQNVFRIPEHPNLVIAVNSAGNDQLLPRRFALWGIVTALKCIVVNN